MSRTKSLATNDKQDLVRAEQLLRRGRAALEPVVYGEEMLTSDMRLRAARGFAAMTDVLGILAGLFARPRENGHTNGKEDSQ